MLVPVVSSAFYDQVSRRSLAVVKQNQQEQCFLRLPLAFSKITEIFSKNLYSKIKYTFSYRKYRMEILLFFTKTKYEFILPGTELAEASEKILKIWRNSLN